MQQTFIGRVSARTHAVAREAHLAGGVAAGGTLVGYMVSALLLGHGIWVQSGFPYYVLLAYSWIHRSWWTNAHLFGTRTVDLTIYHGHLYVAFPPLPALVLIPFVAIFGASTWDVPISIGLGAVNAWLLYRVLGRLASWGVTLALMSRLWLVALFAFGTPVWYVTLDGSVWFMAHVVALTCLLLGILETLRPNSRSLYAALWFGLAGLSRPDAWAAAAFFLAIELALLQRRQVLITLRRVGAFVAAMGIFPLCHSLYNRARFGSPFDPGYQSMHVKASLLPDLHRYGLFNLHYLGRDIYHMFLAPPLISDGAIHPDAIGMSIFVATPSLVYLFGAWRAHQSRIVAWAAIAATICIVAPLVTYYNTGWIQFGSRFAIDFLPFLIILVALSIRSRTSLAFRLLVIISILINEWGILWIVGR